MNIYSEWLRTDAPQTTIVDFAGSVGTAHPETQARFGVEMLPSAWQVSSSPFAELARDAIVSGQRPTVTPGGEGSFEHQRALPYSPAFRSYSSILRLLTFASERRTGWEESRTEGVWTVAIASMTSVNPADGRLVGVLSPQRSLTADVMQDAKDRLSAAERVRFTLRNLFDAQPLGVECISARLSSEQSSVLIKAESGAAFRAIIRDTQGVISGVTVNAIDQRATVLENGEVIFGGDAPITNLLASMSAIAVASARLERTGVR